MSLSAIPNSLDIRELMEVKGGQSGNENIVCVGVSAVSCSQGTSAIVSCAPGVSAIAYCSPGSSAVTIVQHPTTDPIDPPAVPQPTP